MIWIRLIAFCKLAIFLVVIGLGEAFAVRGLQCRSDEKPFFVTAANCRSDDKHHKTS